MILPHIGPVQHQPCPTSACCRCFCVDLHPCCPLLWRHEDVSQCHPVLSVSSCQILCCPSPFRHSSCASSFRSAWCPPLSFCPGEGGAHTPHLKPSWKQWVLRFKENRINSPPFPHVLIFVVSSVCSVVVWWCRGRRTHHRGDILEDFIHFAPLNLVFSKSSSPCYYDLSLCSLAYSFCPYLFNQFFPFIMFFLLGLYYRQVPILQCLSRLYLASFLLTSPPALWVCPGVFIWVLF